MSNKYLPGGAINPAWAKEQEVDHISSNITDALWNIFNSINMELDLELAEGVNLKVSNQQPQYEEKCMCINTNEDIDMLERKFDFIKRHSDSPEDLKLAREIIGLD